MKQYLSMVKNYFSIPLAVGFGISQPEHIRALAGIAYIAIVGSAIIDIFNMSSEEKKHKNVGDFIVKLKMVQ